MKVPTLDRANSVMREHKDLSTEEIKYRANALKTRIEQLESHETVMLNDLNACRRSLKMTKADAAILEDLIKSRC